MVLGNGCVILECSDDALLGTAVSFMLLCSRVAGLLVSCVPGRGTEAVEFLTEGAIVNVWYRIRGDVRLLVVFSIKHELQLVHYTRVLRFSNFKILGKRHGTRCQMTDSEVIS